MKSTDFNKVILLLVISITSIFYTSCNFLLGTKEDEVTDEIFEQGAIDPTLITNQIGYVPILPIWDFFESPKDIIVGFDEMIYVVDNNGLNVLDQKGELHRTIQIENATDVVQNRRLETFVAAKISLDVDNNGTLENVACVYKMVNTATAQQTVFLDTLIHPFADISRTNSSFRGIDDESVEYTGLAILSDNTLYVSRKGPRNNLSAIARPDNAILFFDEDGNNIDYARGLNPVSSSLKSVLEVSALATEVAAPQQIDGISNSPNFIVLQAADNAEFKALHILKFTDEDGATSYIEDVNFASGNIDKADRFLYESFRFEKPTDVYIAPDANRYILVVDEVLDSLFHFSANGLEGVNPPISALDSKLISVSFGGEGNGLFNFNDPSGVCYFEETVFVADKGNNRIMRYRLSTDIE